MGGFRAHQKAGNLRKETWRVALEALWANKLRAFLTTLGVVIGSACIVLVVTVAVTGRRVVIGQIEAVGSNLVYAQYQVNPDEAVVIANEITLADMNAAQAQLAGVVAAAGSTSSVATTVVQGGAQYNASLVGVTEGFQDIRNLVVLQGRFLDSEDMRARSKVCLITEELAALVFPNADPIGARLRAGELSFTVVGVFRERVATFGLSEIQRYTMLLPFPLMRYYNGKDSLGVLYVQVAAPEYVVPLTAQLEGLLRSRHPGGTYVAENLGGVLDAARAISAALTVVLLLVGCIVLLVSGIGIMNIMLVTVTERTREIGVRKAIGARRSEILYQFLIEAGVISGVGSLVGILIALSIPLAVRPFLPGNLQVPIPWMSVVLAFVVACSVGLFFGYLPANRAAQLPPTESLRYE
jgi:putative ABC transport system permease protein